MATAYYRGNSSTAAKRRTVVDVANKRVAVLASTVSKTAVEVNRVMIGG